MLKTTNWAGLALTLLICFGVTVNLDAATASSADRMDFPAGERFAWRSSSNPNPQNSVPNPELVEAASRVETRMDLFSKSGLASESVAIHEPQASFIKVHFSRFAIPDGVVVIVRNPEGTEAYEYRRSRKGGHTLDQREGDDGKHRFSAMSISGDTAVIEISGNKKQINGLTHQVSIDYYMRGYPENQASQQKDDLTSISRTQVSSGRSKPVTQSTCGANERYDAVCWEDTNPEEFDRSWPVAKLLMNGSSLCTGWRVGSDNRMFTNNHCVATQAELDSVEVWFDYQKLECGNRELAVPVKVTGAELLATDWYLDYALFTVSNFEQISPFGYLGLDIGAVQSGADIYIPQHGLGFPKQIAIESDMNIDGYCQVDDPDHDGRDEGSDIGYYCDTTGGSSGSPVISSNDHKVIALHHNGGCLNSGVKISRIWPQVSGFFGGVVPEGMGEPPPSEIPPTASFVFNCSSLVCGFDGTGSTATDGHIQSWTWDFGNGQSASGPQVSHTFEEEGNYWVTLTVNDNSDLADSQLRQVETNAPNANPSAAFSYSCTDLDCSFDASLSSDSDGQLVTYAWNFGDGASSQSSQASASHSFQAGGSYGVSLTVTDNEGGSASAQSTIAVAETVANQQPNADYSYQCSDLDCTFDATSSNDPDGLIVSYVWNFGDGESSESGGPVKAYRYSAPGQYFVSLQVEDNQGTHSSATLAIEVTTTTPEPPPQMTIDLVVQGFKHRGSKWAELTWSGATSGKVDVFRDGALLEIVQNDGNYTDNQLSGKTKSAVYRVCAAGTNVCSGNKEAFF